jgi:hypothetical protein
MKQRIQIIATTFTMAIATLTHAAPPAAEPFLELKLNIPRALSSVVGVAPEEAKTNAVFQAKLDFVRDLKLSNAYLFLYPDADFESLPILMVTSADPTALPALVAETGLLHPHLDKVSANSYKLKPELLTDEAMEDLPLDEYRVWITKNTLLFAPISIATTWAKGAPKPMTTPVAKTLAALQSKNHALSCAVRIAKDIEETDWDEVSGELPIPAGEGSDVIATVGSEMLAEMSEAFSSIESFAFGVHLASDGQRVIEYAQEFRAAADIAALFKKITQGGNDNEDPSDLISILASVILSEDIAMTPALQGNHMSLKLAWAQESDESVLQAVGGYIMGQLMRAAMGGMGMTMSSGGDDGPVETDYTSDPVFEASITAAQLEKRLTEDILNSLFRGSFFDHGDKPRMTMTLDPLDVPNVSLTEMTYKITSVTGPDGASVMRPDDRDTEKWGPRKIHLSHNNETHIEFPVQKGTKAEQLEKGVLHIDVTAPSSLAIVEFTKDEAGTKKQAGGASVKLTSVGAHSASITFKGGKSAEILAYDATGGCLDWSSGMGSGSSKTRSFDGTVERIKVVVTEAVATFGMDLACDLGRGEKEELPEAPTDDVRTRYDRNSVSRYADYSTEDLDSLEVEWKEAGEQGRQDQLLVSLPHSTFSGAYKWEAQFLGPKGMVLLDGDRQRSGDKLSYTMKKGSLATVNAAVGALNIKVDTAIQTLIFTKETEGAALEQVLPSGKKITVTFNENAVAISDNDSKVLGSRGYAQNGRMLKANWRSGSDGKTYWGIPTRFELDVADDQIEKTIPFTIVERPVTDDALVAFKQKAAQLATAVRELKSLAQDTRRISSYEYDESVASFYYLYDRRGNPRETKLISEALAHSDPVGAARYGYTVTPHHGYHFMRLKGTIGKDGKKQDNQHNDSERTYKWDGGEFQFKPLSRAAAFVAIPVDKSMPTLCNSWSEIYVRNRNGEKTEYLEESLYGTEWKQFDVLD